MISLSLPLLLLFNDVTNKRELKEQRISEKYKNILLCSFSHEMRTPLNIIMSTIKEMRKITKAPVERDAFVLEKYLSHLRWAKASARALSRKVNEMLDLVQLQFGDFVLHPEPTDLQIVSKKLIKHFQNEQRTDSVKLIQNTQLEKASLYYIDQERLEQVLSNLLSNALKYTSEGKVELLISFERGLLHFEVSDTGAGMRAEQVQKLFKIAAKDEDANSLKTHKKSFGLCGMGLTICQEIVKQMNSEIKVESVFSKGSKFWFELKATKAEHAKYYSSIRGKSVGSFGEIEEKKNLPSKRLKNKSIYDLDPKYIEEGIPNRPLNTCLPPSFINRLLPLVVVVDDALMNRVALKGMLSKYKSFFELYEAQNGIEAVNLFKSHCLDSGRICLIFMDIEMPEMDGIEATIRKFAAFSQ